MYTTILPPVLSTTVRYADIFQVVPSAFSSNAKIFSHNNVAATDDQYMEFPTWSSHLTNSGHSMNDGNATKEVTEDSHELLVTRIWQIVNRINP